MSEASPQVEENQSYERDQVIQIINSVISKVEHTEDDSKLVIFQELQELQKIIESARAEIGLTRPSEINDKHIPTATDELDAVVEATAEATGTIMDCCEVIQEQAAGAGAPGDIIMNETMKIFEACSFQDITGQRITKVVTTLKDIEIKVDKLMGIIGSKMHEAGDADETKKVETTSIDATPSLENITDEDLLNGPQLPGAGVSQDDIDALLAEFD